MYLPNLELLLFLVVLALPNASMIGFVAKGCHTVQGLDYFFGYLFHVTYP
jgi:hypothetical protein